MAVSRNRPRRRRRLEAATFRARRRGVYDGNPVARRAIMTRFRFLPLLMLACAFAPAAFAETPAQKSAPASENGRYSMSPVADGVLRLDTRTGQVSLCRQRNDSWVCEATADDRAAYEKEIARL